MRLTAFLIIAIIVLIVAKRLRCNSVEPYDTSLQEVQYVNSKYKVLMNDVKKGLPQEDAKVKFDMIFKTANQLILDDSNSENKKERIKGMTTIKMERLKAFKRLYSAKDLDVEINEQKVKFKLV